MNTQTDAWNTLLLHCLDCKDTKELGKLFSLLLTKSEEQELKQRFLILRELLYSTKPQRQIAHDLGVSLFNVTRGANAIKNCPHNIKKLIKNLC